MSTYTPTRSAKTKLRIDCKSPYTNITSAPFAADPKRKRIPTPFIMAGIALLILVPPGILVAHHFNQKSQEELAEQQEAQAAAERSIEAKSVVAKPQEPFRMPAGGTGTGSAPPATHSDTSSTPNEISKADRERAFDWHPPSNQQAPLNASQVAAASSEMAKADGFSAAGYSDRAVSLYIDLLHKYPSYTLLRAKAARAYIAMKQFRQAYEICAAGLDSCPTKSDFDMLVGIIREIP